MKRIAIVFFLCISICMYFTGCGKKDAGSEDILTICVDPDFETGVKDVLALWEALHDGAKSQVIVLPRDSDTRNITISRIRTELMSGSGPDVFLLTAREDMDTDPVLKVFPYPEKSMYADVFLSMDEFMENPVHAHPEYWNETVLNAGRTSEGLMILPLSYHYIQYAFPAEKAATGDLPASWEALIGTENPWIRNEMYCSAYTFYPILGKLADYEKENLNFTETELSAIAGEAAEFIISAEKEKELTDSISISGYNDAFYKPFSIDPDNLNVVGFPNADGGVTAYIDAYAAVNRNTTKKDQALSFLDLLFSDEILFGQGMTVGEKQMGNLLFYSLWTQLIDDRCIVKRYPDLPKEKLEALEKVREKINAVTFYSDMEKDLEDLFLQYMQSCYHGEAESVREELITTIYDRMQMKVME